MFIQMHRRELTITHTWCVQKRVHLSFFTFNAIFNFIFRPVFPFQPPINQQPFPPSGNPQQQPIPPSATGQINGPFRQRSIESDEPSSDILNSSITQFIRTMETQFREKHQRNGQKYSGKCEERFFCEVAMMGRLPKAEALHRMLYNVALEWDLFRWVSHNA